MKVTYAPEGADPRVWMFRPGKLMNVEAEEIERVTGMDFNEWAEKLPPATVNMRALHGLLYILLKREIPTLKYAEVEFTADELDFELELDEKRLAVTNLKQMLAEDKVPAEAVDDVRDALVTLEREIADEAGAKDDAEAPKAELNSADAGSGTSPTTSTSTLQTSIA